MKSSWTTLIIVILAQIVSVPRATSAQDAESRLRDALAAFDSAVATKSHSGPEAQRLYRQALDGFQSLAGAGIHSGGLHYNIANTYLRLGEVGRAIVNYRRALRLDPGNEKIRKNLQVARSMCESQFSRPAASAFVETLLFWHFGTSPALRLKTCLAAYVLFWIAMLARVLVPHRVPALRWMAAVLAGLALVTGASIGWDKASAAHHIEGVLITDKVLVRKGNGDYYDPQFNRPLSQGVEFRVLEMRLDVQGASWYHVELPDGQNGWLRADQADVI